MASIRKRTWTTQQGAEREAWIVDYFAVDPATGKNVRRQKSFATQKAAKAWSINAMHEVQQGTHTPVSISKTVSEAWELWIEDCGSGDKPLEAGTIEQRKQHLKWHVAPFIGQCKLAELTTPSVNNFVKQLREGGRSFAMRRKVLTNLKTMLTFAQGQGLVAQNVARGIRLKSDDRSAPAPLRAGVDFPTKAELNTLVDAAKGRWRPLIVTAIFTGMRASELRGLPWTDVDLEKGVIHVRQRADKRCKIGRVKSKAAKRDIPLAPIVVNALRQWKGEDEAEGVQVCPKGELGLVFPNGRGKVESLTNIYKRCWHPLQTKCELTADFSNKDAEGKPLLEPRYGFHMLRHAAASLFIAYLGWTPKRLQTVMRHSSIKVTFDTYGHLFENVENDRADMAKIEAAIRAA